MAGNGYGRRTTIEALMREHDKLPPDQRLVGAFAIAKWTPSSVPVAFRDAARENPSAKRGELMLRALQLLDDQCGKDTFAAYGPDHPECPPEFRNKKPPRSAWWNKKRAGK